MSAHHPRSTQPAKHPPMKANRSPHGGTVHHQPSIALKMPLTVHMDDPTGTKTAIKAGAAVAAAAIGAGGAMMASSGHHGGHHGGGGGKGGGSGCCDGCCDNGCFGGCCECCGEDHN